ncbi:hypothetical protein IQ07DRAFT_632281 [Pyrenochaeta sp. DS3sAY3a]|nr:hypothetical protein IQ07DRAFT_632281 [Pyrenochaeta sp. DS3sAY3a]
MRGDNRPSTLQAPLIARLPKLVRPPNSNSNATSDPNQTSSWNLTPISEQEAKEYELPSLKFMPLMLRSIAVCGTLTFCLVVLGLLVTLTYFPRFTFKDGWGHIALKTIPAIVGTITASSVDSITVELSRITPFMLAARPQGSTFGQTILANYFPGLSLRAAIKTGNISLSILWILQMLSHATSLTDLKAQTLRQENQSMIIWVIEGSSSGIGKWVTSFGMALASCVARSTASSPAVLINFAVQTDCVVASASNPALPDQQKTKQTSLVELETISNSSWRSESTLRPSNSVSRPVDEDGTPRNSKSGPNEANKEDFSLHNNVRQPERTQPLITKKFSMLELSNIRYRSTALNMEPLIAYIWMGLATLLIAACIIGLALQMEEGKTIPISYPVATFILQFLPSFFVSMFTIFWQDIGHFTRTNQPFKGMAEPNLASETLLLNYSTLPALVVPFVALWKGHTRVAWTSSMAMIQRLLPILTSTTITVVPCENGSSTIFVIRLPLVVTMIWLALYLLLIPLAIMGKSPLSYRSVDRHLPRTYNSISDLIAWSYASKLLRSGDGDLFDVSLTKPMDGREYMIARIVLNKDRDESDAAKYAFGMDESSKYGGVKCVGFDISSNVDTVEYLKASEDAEMEGGKITMLKRDGFLSVLDVAKERFFNLKPSVEQTPPDML